MNRSNRIGTLRTEGGHRHGGIVLLALMTALMPSTLVRSAPISFDGPRTYPCLGGNLSGANAVATADFNGDGKPDLAAATSETSSVSVFLNRGDGTFGEATKYAGGSYLSYVATGDFNGDGRADLITADVAPGTVSVLLGRGDGSFQDPVASPAGIYPGALAVGDFNHDGKLDVAVAGGSAGILDSHGLLVLLGNGDGTFQAPTNNLLTDYQYFVTTGDFNGDGNLDLVTGNGIQAWILLGHGDGSFEPALSLPSEGGSPYGNAAAAGDFNGDGKLDIAIGNSTHQESNVIPGTVTILLGNGDGTFVPVPSIQTGQYPYSVAVADFDGDGKLDVAICEAGDAMIRVFSGKGDGTFQPGVQYPVGGEWLNCLAVVDLNGDGRPDLAASSGFSDGVSVLLSKTGGGFHGATVSSEGKQPDTVFASQPYAVTAADFNGDGKMDAAVANTATDDISILLGNGDGSFAAPIEYSVGDFPASIATADFDGDGNPDLAVVNHTDSTISILLGNGDGTFQAAVNYPAGTIFAIMADFDKDGKLDIASLGSAGDGSLQVSVLGGNGDGTFRPAVNSAVPGSEGNGVALADFNQDGKADLVIINYDASNAVIMLGNGDGTFQPAAATVSVFNPNSVATGDFNHDGKPDFAVADGLLNQLHIFLGHGDGSFQAIPQRYAVGDASFTMSAIDLNGDSILDLAVSSANYHYVAILEGNGDGTFKLPKNYGASKGPTGFAVADFDGDGKPDLATTGFWLSKVSTLINTTPVALPVPLLGAVSRKVHDLAGTFDIDLPADGSGIECRSGGASGDYTLVFTFANVLTTVDSVSASATSSSGSQPVSSNGGIGADPHQYIVNLSGVPNAQYVTATLNGVHDNLGNVSVTVPVTMGVLLGDVNGSGRVDSGDVSLVRQQTLQDASASNFRNDINATGRIDSGDVFVARQQTLTSLP